MYTIVSYIATQKKGLQIIIIIRGRRLGAMGTRTKIMKTTNIPSILILFHSVAEIGQLLANGSIV